MAFAEFLAFCAAVFGDTGYMDQITANPIEVGSNALTDRVTLDALLDRTLSLSASTVLCYPAANYTVAFVEGHSVVLEVFICRTIRWQPVCVEVGRRQHPPGVGGGKRF